MSTPQNMSRKRPAPGAEPYGYSQQTQPTYTNPAAAPLTDDQFFNWGAESQDPNSYPNPAVYNMQPNMYPPQGAPQSNQSNQLTRRPVNQMVTRQPQPGAQWMPDEQAAIPPQQQTQEPATTWSDDIDELVAKAQVAKREAQSKRKQIPPFVLKLHSFLENPKNTNLIRWADDGKSFIVLNEDEFANKLIPELFKHNNYASFVRQLNMYGFHKKVGLSDNSMRASERKAKSPSEYSNPFFRKGYPDLLWLIQKPKNQTTSKGKGRGKSEERDEEDDFQDDMNGATQFPVRPLLTQGPQGQSQNQSQSPTALTPEQFATVQRELMMIRRQQHQITHMLGQLKQEHDALVNQASDYQNKHSRHEQSINAILTFLATLYNRSLQNHDGAQDIAKIIANTLSQDKNGGVVDINDLVFDLADGASPDQIGQPQKKQRLLLTDGTENRANTLSPSTAAASPANRASRRSSHRTRSPQSAQVEEIFDPEVNQPSHNYHPGQQDQRQQDMMSLINNTNARNSGNNTPIPDFSNVLNDLESSGGTTPVNAAQRENMLRVFNNQSQRPMSSGSTTSRDNRALVSPSRTNPQVQQFENKMASNKHGLDHIEQLQAAQEKSVENLANLLQPLSPTGSIPGIGDGQDIPPPPLDIDAFLGNDYFQDFNNAANGDFDFANANNNAYTANGNNAGFDFTDDDPLFADVPDNKDSSSNFLDVNDYDDHDETGRVESVASSSDAPTPKPGGYGADGAGQSNSKRTRKS